MIRHSPRARNRKAISCRAATVTLALATFLVSACGGGGGSSNPPPPPPSASLSYASPQLYVVGTAIAPLKPTITGTLSGFAVNPGLPFGLAIDTNTGIISGTPTAVAAKATYAVSAIAGGTTTSAALTITVNDVPPSSISYGAAALTFTTGIAARMLTPTTIGGTVVSWSISPSLPAGLVFSTTDGSISGTPTVTSARTPYTVTAQNSGGQASAGLSIEIDSSVLMDLGHANAISLVRFSGSRVVSEDTSGHWVLWNYATAKSIHSGDSDCAPTQTSLCLQPLLADVAGSTAAIKTKGGFELYSSLNGQALSTITASAAWWHLATDGSYICAGSQASLLAWSPSGAVLISRAGDYSKAIAFAAPGEIRIATGPAGQNVIETVAVPSGTATIGPSFQGQFSSWFLDGARFLTVAGSTVAVYSSASVRQELQTLPSVAGLTGQGNWFWTYPNPGAVLNIYLVGSGSSPTATYTTGPLDSVIPSGLTIGIIQWGTGQITVIDLSGAAPSKAVFASPVPNGVNLNPLGLNFPYAAISSTQWLVGNGAGVVFDGSGLPAAPRYFALGQVRSIAGGASSISVATASGSIFNFDAGTLAPTSTIPFTSSKLMSSSDGTVLAALGDTIDAPYGSSDCSLNIYSLPSATLLHNWSYSCTGSTQATDFDLSSSGGVLGQSVYFNGTSPTVTVLVTAATGGSPLYSNTYTPVSSAPPIRLSPDGTLIATSVSDSGSTLVPGETYGTNLIENGTLVTAVSGLPSGWIDNNRLLVDNYERSPMDPPGPGEYVGCTVNDPSGHVVGSCALPVLPVFQTITSDLLYGPNWNSIFSVSAGTATWTSGDPLSPSNLWSTAASAVAGTHVVFPSGPRVLVQAY